MNLNPFKGGTYDISETLKSWLPGGAPAQIITHSQPQAAPAGGATSNDQFETDANKPEWAKLGFASEDDYWAAMRNGIDGGTGSETKSNIDVIDGVSYNLNDPGQFQAYVAAANSKLDANFEYFRNSTEGVRDEDIAEAKAQEERTLYQIEQALKKVSEQKGQYETDYTRSLSDLAEGFRQGTAKRQTFYASVAPRVYQSSQGTSQEYAKGKYGEGQQRYAEDRNRAMNAFRDTENEYNQSRQDTTNQFNLYKTRREREAQDAIFNQAQTNQGQRDAMMAKTKNWSADKGGSFASNKWGGTSFNSKDLSGYSPSNVSLNDLAQFIKFQPVGMAGNTKTVQSAPIATPESGGQSLGNYMGYQEIPTEESTLNKFKTGKGLY